jgi:hypothetical protein
VHLILGGQFDGPAAERVFREGAAALCPDVTLHLMDGRMPGFRANAFSAADFFTSLVDNIQETFGLAPVEAMAAGLPVVVSDWDGYRDTVEDGVQGFRVPTLMTVSGSYLASRYTVWAEGNNSYLSGVGQFVAMDVPAAEAAYRTLIADPARRQAMGAAARAHARAKYDWSVVIGQHLELWETLARLRGEAVTSERAPHTAGREPVPLRPNPFAAFASYPTHRLGPDTVLALAEGASTGRAKELAGVPGAVVRGDLLPSWAEMSAVLERLGDGGPTTARALASQAASQPHRQLRLLRGLAWLAKLDLVRRQD